MSFIGTARRIARLILGDFERARQQDKEFARQHLQTLQQERLEVAKRKIENTSDRLKAINLDDKAQDSADQSLTPLADAAMRDKHTIDLCTALRLKLADIVSDDAVKYAAVSVGDLISDPAEEGSFSAGEEQTALRNPHAYVRWKATTSKHALSVRGHVGLIELFLVPIDEVALQESAEHDVRLIGKLDLKKTEGGYLWIMDGVPSTPADLQILLRNALERLISPASRPASLLDSRSLLVISGGQNAADIPVKELMIERQNLIFKIVNQQEEIKNALARELHDSVIADLMMLKRYVLGDKKLTETEIVEHIDEAVKKLRELCSDFAPRNLQDWGLKTSLQAMLEQMEERTGIDCSLIFDATIPSLPEMVQLHIYRIIQEALNNVEKYAGASRVIVEVAATDDKLTFSVRDNGKGFDPVSLTQDLMEDGGMGMGTMKERAALIRCFCPCEFEVNSEPGKGATVKLEITCS